MKENREYRSDVFSMLMEEPKYALEVYNAFENTTYDDPQLIEMKTLEKGISLSVRNDVAFIIESDLNIYEHQSSYNPNMPLRGLLTQFVEIVKHNINEEIEGPIEKAIGYCIEHHILEDFLKDKKDKVIKNMTLDMTFERREELIRKEEREEGIKEGIREGQESLIKAALSSGSLPEDISKVLGIDYEMVLEIQKKM